MRYFVLSPEVAGGLGSRTLFSQASHPPIVSQLHYEMDVWLGDELLEGFPCFLVTTRVADLLRHAGLSGVDFGVAEVTTSEQFQELYPDRVIPNFEWLQPVGVACDDDFGVDSNGRLILSEKALQVLRDITLAHCEIREV